MIAKLKRLGAKTVAFVVILILMMLVLAVFRHDGSMDIYTFSILEIGAVAFIFLNIIDRYRLLDREAKKMVKEGDRLFKKGEIKGAQSRYEEASIYDHKNCDAFMGLGHCYKTKDRWDEAAGFFEKACNLNPGLSYAHYYKGFCHSKTGKLDTAIRDFEKAIEMNASLQEAYLSLGDIYAIKGDDLKAKEFYCKFLEKPHDDSVIKPVKEKIENLDKIIQLKETANNSVGISPPDEAETVDNKDLQENGLSEEQKQMLNEHKQFLSEKKVDLDGI